MKKDRGILRMQVCRLFTRNEFKIAWVLCIALLAIAYIEKCFAVWNKDQSDLFSAAMGWVGHVYFSSGNGIQLFCFFGICIFAALPFADSFLEDKASRNLPAILTRGSWKSYVRTGLLLTFLSGFAVILVSLLAFQLLSFVVFPEGGELPLGSFGAGAWKTPAIPAEDYLFPSLFLNFPYLHNMVFIFYAALFAGFNAVASYLLSLLGVRKKLFVLCLPTVFWLLYNGIVSFIGGRFSVYIYLYPNYSVFKELWYFFALPVILLALLAAGCVAVKRRKTEAIL